MTNADQERRRPGRRLSDEQLGEMLALIKDADTVELKLTVPEPTSASAVQRSGWTR